MLKIIETINLWINYNKIYSKKIEVTVKEIPKWTIFYCCNQYGIYIYQRIFSIGQRFII
jgi:hypothetical protein